jgi:hypothetical protein
MNQAATPAAPAAAEKVKDEKNGVTRPGADSATGKVWKIADDLSAKAGQPAARKDVLAAAEKEGINVTTAATQFGRWCKYHGIKKAPTEPKPAKEKKAKKEKTDAAAAAAAVE